MMKLLLLCFLPVLMGSPIEQKRVLVADLHLMSAFDLSTLKCDIQKMLDVIGGDPTEAACETECHHLLASGHLLNYGCPVVCHGFQALVHKWHVVPDTTDPAVSKCHSTQTAVGK